MIYMARTTIETNDILSYFFIIQPKYTFGVRSKETKSFYDLKGTWYSAQMNYVTHVYVTVELICVKDRSYIVRILRSQRLVSIYIILMWNHLI